VPSAEALIVTSADLGVQDAEKDGLTVMSASPPTLIVPPPAPQTRVSVTSPDETDLNAPVAENDPSGTACLSVAAVAARVLPLICVTLAIRPSGVARPTPTTMMSPTLIEAGAPRVIVMADPAVVTAVTSAAATGLVVAGITVVAAAEVAVGCGCGADPPRAAALAAPGKTASAMSAAPADTANAIRLNVFHHPTTK
jgi:hypothetical protein